MNGYLHAERRGRPQIPERDRCRSGRHQRADPVPVPFFSFTGSRGSKLAIWGLRQAGGAVLHADQDHHLALVRRCQRFGRREHHHQPEVRIEDTAAVISGGASGLGRAVAERIVARGGRAVILDVQEEAGHAAAREIGATFVRAT